MNMTSAKILPSFLLLARISLCMPQAFAETGAPAPKATANKIQVKTVKEKKSAIADADSQEPDVKGATLIEYGCELGNKLAIYQNTGDGQHIALHWKKRLYRLTRADTSTGANRFENRKFGLLWIGIPAKGILLDSQKGQQLANECRNSEQLLANTQSN